MENNGVQKTDNDDILVVKAYRKVKKVKVEQEDGRDELYTVREMMGDDRDKYLNFVTGRSKTDAQGNRVGVTNYEDIQANLIARCLYNQEDKLVGLDGVRKLPATTQQALFDLCQKINGLTEETKEAEKKVS